MTNPVFVTAAQLDTTLKLARAGGLWWPSSLREDEISGLVGMTADEIKTLCDHAVERDIADDCDESNWREDPRPHYTTCTGRTRWTVRGDGSVEIRIYRPAGLVMSARWDNSTIQLTVHESAAVHLRHVAALIQTLRALDPKAEAKVWHELGDHPALFARLVEEEREWEAHAAEWAGRATVDPFQWRSSLEAAS